MNFLKKQYFIAFLTGRSFDQNLILKWKIDKKKPIMESFKFALEWYYFQVYTMSVAGAFRILSFIFKSSLLPLVATISPDNESLYTSVIRCFNKTIRYVLALSVQKC